MIRDTWRQDNVPAHIRTLMEDLRLQRFTDGVSQRELAEVAGMAQSQVSDIETMRVEPRMSTLTAYADALGYDLHIELRRKEMK